MTKRDSAKDEMEARLKRVGYKWRSGNENRKHPGVKVRAYFAAMLKS